VYNVGNNPNRNQSFRQLPDLKHRTRHLVIGRGHAL
jgi:hypothetical protein